MQKFLLEHFGVSHVKDIKPQSKFPGTTSQFTREMTVNVKLTNDGSYLMPIPEKIDFDKDHVSPKTLIIRYSSLDPKATSDFLFGRTYVHPLGKEDLERQEQVAKTFGGIPNAVMRIKPGKNSADNIPLLCESKGEVWLNTGYLKTHFLVTPKNIWNGIIKISPELCAESELPKKYEYFDERGETVSEEADFYYLVPYDHLLSWPLRIPDDMRRAMGLFAFELRADISDDDRYILYYIVPDKILHKIHDSCVKQYIQDKIDVRPLSSVGVCVRPVGIPSIWPTIDFTCTFICCPPGLDKDALFPDIDKSFIEFGEIIRVKMEKQMEKMELERLNKKSE